MNPPPQLLIRPASAKDAAAMIAFMHRLTNEPHNNVTFDPGQWSMSLEEERAYIARRNADRDQGLFAVAEIAGAIVGAASLERGARPTNRHTALLGISVDAAFRRQGIGTALMHHLLAWARSHQLIRIELKVFTRNAPAIALYQKLGFTIEGRHPQAFLKQGLWVEELTMALLLPDPPP